MQVRRVDQPAIPVPASSGRPCPSGPPRDPSRGAGSLQAQHVVAAYGAHVAGQVAASRGSPRRAQTMSSRASTWPWVSSRGGQPAASAASRSTRVRIARGSVSRPPTSSPAAKSRPAVLGLGDRRRGRRGPRAASRRCAPGPPATPGPSSASSSGIDDVTHPGAQEPLVAVVRVLPPGDALGAAGGLGLRAGQVEQGPLEQRAARLLELAAHALHRARPRPLGQPEQHGLGLVVEGVAQQHPVGAEVLGQPARARRTARAGRRPPPRAGRGRR